MHTKRILLTPGEPAGIGPELAVRAAQQARDYELVAIADPSLLKSTAETLNLPLTLRTISTEETPKACLASELGVIPVHVETAVKPGELNKANANYVVEMLSLANDLCMNQLADAVTTGPVQKSIINDAGIPFTGHTEFFADHSNTENVVMMLASGALRVALATTHVPLKAVSEVLTQTHLRQVIHILHSELKRTFNLKNPRILVCGLNPHAGEGGHLGREEIEIIDPVLSELRAQAINVIGPLPADTLFTPRVLQDADAVLAMYHDQGLPVLKFQGFGEAVNITLGLPYIRTSVDHGTALDLVGTGNADMGSLNAALQQAYTLACNVNSTRHMT